nr:hypothetical protein [Paraburkholderia sp. PGU16]
MPQIASWVRDLRSAFGDAQLDDAISRGRNGEPDFFASENGRTFGTRLPAGSAGWAGEGLGDRHFCAGCDGSCIGTQTRCSSSPAARVAK